jgi:uncharacterized membrane protein
MKNWKTKFFGDNTFNFCGWIVVGLATLGGSLWTMLLVLRTSSKLSEQLLPLMPIWILLLAIFGLSWQNYLARVAEKLEAQEKEKTGSIGA